MRGLLKLGALAGLGYMIYSKLRSVSQESVEDDHGPVGSSGIVRNAGPEAQTGIKNSDWDQVDEQIDESFPASDPPGSY